MLLSDVRVILNWENGFAKENASIERWVLEGTLEGLGCTGSESG